MYLLLPYIVEDKILFLLLLFLDEAFYSRVGVVLFCLDGIPGALLGLFLRKATAAVLLSKGLQFELFDLTHVGFLFLLLMGLLRVFIGWICQSFGPLCLIRTFSF